MHSTMDENDSFFGRCLSPIGQIFISLGKNMMMILQSNFHQELTLTKEKNSQCNLCRCHNVTILSGLFKYNQALIIITRHNNLRK